MLAHYFCDDNQSKIRQEFSDLDGTIVFLSKYANPQGIIFVREVSDLKIKYDLMTGKVKAVFPNPTKNIKNFYSAKAFKSLTYLIKDAICSLARLELLLEISKLDDEDLHRFIHSKHYHPNLGFKNIGLHHVNNSLERILNNTHKSIIVAIFNRPQLTPAHKAVREALEYYGIHKIIGKNDVQIIIEKIKGILDGTNHSDSNIAMR